METVIKIVAGIAIGYAALVAGCAVFQRSLMYFPDQSLPDPAAAGAPEMKKVRLETSDGLSLVAWYAPAQGHRSTIVYFHGNGGNIAGRVFKIRPFLEAGYGVLLVSYRGYGGNPGKPTEEGLYRDGYAALEFVAIQDIPSDRVVLIGESLGSGVAVRMASEQSVQGLILEAPFTSAADVGKRSFFFLPVDALILDRFDSLSHIAQVDAPILLVHGERDRVVPTKLGRRLFEAAEEPKEARFLPAAGHNDMFEHGLIELELDFLRRLNDG